MTEVPLGDVGPGIDAFRYSSLVGRRAILRPVAPSDYEFLYRISVSPEESLRWRFRGRSVSVEEFVQLLWHDVLCHFIIESRETRQAVGYVTSYKADFRNGTAHFGVLLAPDAHNKGWPIEGVAIFFDHLFLSYPLRKMYAEIPEFNLMNYAHGIGHYFTEEGRLKDHEFHDGRYWDQVVLAIYRETVEANADQVLGPDRYLTVNPATPPT